MFELLRKFLRIQRLTSDQRLQAILLKELLEYPGQQEQRLVTRIGVRWGSETAVKRQIEACVIRGLISVVAGSERGLFLTPRGRDHLSDLGF